MDQIVRSRIICDSSITTEHLIHANQIYVTVVNDLKYKTYKRKIPQVQVELDAVPTSILVIYRNLTCSTNIMFANNIPFIAATSLNIRYILIFRLLNCQVPTILNVCKIMLNLYAIKGFMIRVMKMDPEFEPLSFGLDQM